MAYDRYCHHDQSVKAIGQAEADIAQCMADFICCILDELKCDHKRSVGDKILLFKVLITAAAVKEKAIASVLKALAWRIKAENEVDENNAVEEM